MPFSGSEVTRTGPFGMPRPPYSGFSAAVTAAVTGTASSGLTEAQIVSGGETIIITLTSDTWVAAGATFNAQRQNIIDGLDSAQSEATGWNAEVRDKEVVTAVERTSNTVVTITLTAATYDVTADETITVTVPASALVTSGDAVIATPTITVSASASVVSFPDMEWEDEKKKPKSIDQQNAARRKRDFFEGDPFDDIDQDFDIL
jgi:hypothetical protein